MTSFTNGDGFSADLGRTVTASQLRIYKTEWCIASPEVVPSHVGEFVELGYRNPQLLSQIRDRCLVRGSSACWSLASKFRFSAAAQMIWRDIISRSPESEEALKSLTSNSWLQIGLVLATAD